MIAFTEFKGSPLSALRLDADLFVLTPLNKMIDTFKETGHEVHTENLPYSDMLGKAYNFLGTSPARYEYLRSLSAKQGKCISPRISKRVKRDPRKIIGIFT